MPPITLPLSFNNSFWTQDYRRGLETLFKKLEQGVAENGEIISFIEARIIAEYQLATALSTPAATSPQGFSSDDGASLFMAFFGLKQEAKVQGDAHRAIATDLRALALDPFSSWAKGHEQRIRDARINLLDIWLREYEQSIGEVNKLRSTYHMKTRKADEAEDDAKFAPNNDLNDHYTATSPRMNGKNAVVNRTASVSERITERLKELRVSKPAPAEQPAVGIELVLPDSDKQDGEETPTLTRGDKGKGRAVETSSPQPMSPVTVSAPLPPPKPSAPVPILLAGLAIPPAALSNLLRRAQAELPLRPVRLPILGEYPDCFTGEDLVDWIGQNVEGFGGSIDLAAEAARGIAEDQGLLRRIGEFGNDFEASSEAFYQFRPKAFTLGDQQTGAASTTTLQPVTDNLLKRSGTIADFVMKQIKTGPAEPPHIRARHEAQDADNIYRGAVRRLDRQRLALEDRIEESFKLLQHWEIDRLRAIKDVLLKYHATVSNLPSVVQPSLERQTTLIASYQPESDLNALIERYRTGPFRPQPHVYESAYHDGTDVVFGIDLRKWAGESGWAAVRVPDDEKKKEIIPPVLASLLQALEVAYGKLPSDEERRRSWIYEIPLPVVHHLREALNSRSTDVAIPVEFFEKVDAPTLAGVTKLWLLELDPPVGTWEGWDDFRKIYPPVGSKNEGSQEQRIEDVQGALFKLPKVHLYVLDAVIKHVKTLVNSTKSEEDVDVYLTKLAFSIGRTILRPKQETEISIQDRHHTSLFLDLIKHYDAILPPTIVKKKRESEKPLPMRKRTALVDQRINRRNAGSDPKQLLEARGAQIRAPSPSPPEVPPLPSMTTEQKVPTPASVGADDDLPPRPKFATPPPEDDERKDPAAVPERVSPPAPDEATSPTSPKQVSSPKPDISKSPVPEEKAFVSAGSSLSRSGSGEASRVRRPGGARGPRAAPGGATAHRVSGSFTEGAKVRPKSPPQVQVPHAPAADPKQYIPRKKDGRISAAAFGARPAAGDNA